MSAIGSSTRVATSRCVRLSVIRSRIASWTRAWAGRRQRIRTIVGGASASRNASALAIPSAELASERAEYDWLVAAAANNAIVSRPAANARRRIRGRAPEHSREPVQQVGEEQQEGNVEPLQEVLHEPLRMLRHDLRLPQDDHDPERPEAKRRPGRRAVPLPPPLVDRGKRQYHVSHEADVAQNLHSYFQLPPPGPATPVGRVPDRLYAEEREIARMRPVSCGKTPVSGL